MTFNMNTSRRTRVLSGKLACGIGYRRASHRRSAFKRIHAKENGERQDNGRALDVETRLRSELEGSTYPDDGQEYEDKTVEEKSDALEEPPADFTNQYDGEEYEDFIREEDRELVYIVGVQHREHRTDNRIENSGESLRELESLAHAAQCRVVGSTLQKLDKPRAATLIGKGKAFQIKREARQVGATTIFFDCELSPTQAKNLEKIVNSKVAKTPSYDHNEDNAVEDPIDSNSANDLFSTFKDSPFENVEEEEQERIRVSDRTALILDIFSQRAATREGKLQVEMAQAQYQLPRLTKMWTHLERQSGGAGAGSQTKGMGEKQIEVDKRLLRKRISSIKRELEQVRFQREQFRRKRAGANIPVVALVGYTNAGKSSLLNCLSQAYDKPGSSSSSKNKKTVIARDQLFATLDPTTRRVKLPCGKIVLISDTVGFVQQLPSTLIAAFRATLEEIGAADLLLHVVDVSSPFAYAQVEAVENTLAEIPGANDLPVIHVWNKIDLAGEPDAIRDAAAERWPFTVCMSAATGEGVEDLLHALEANIASAVGMQHIDIVLPYDRGDLLDLIHSKGVLDEVYYLPEGTRITAVVPQAYATELLEFSTKEVL